MGPVLTQASAVTVAGERGGGKYGTWLNAFS